LDHGTSVRVIETEARKRAWLDLDGSLLAMRRGWFRLPNAHAPIALLATVSD